MTEIKNILSNLNKLRLRNIRTAISKQNGFLRVIISENGLHLCHIDEGKIKQKMEIALPDKLKIFEYLHKFPRLPLDIIISSNTMSCRSIALNNLHQKDMETLARNILSGKNGLINLVCYEKKFSYRTGTSTLCNMKLSPSLEKVLQELLNIGNPIRTTITSPIWIVQNYLKLYPSEVGKFEAQIFAVNSRLNKEIIVLRDKQYVFYKKIITQDFSEDAGIEEAIKFLNQISNTELNNIAIYKFDDKTLDTFTKNLNTDMLLISQSENYSVANKVVNLNFVAKTVCCCLFLFLGINSISNVIEIFDYNSRINKAQKMVSSVGADVVSEVKLWKNLNDYIFLKPLNIKSKLTEKFKTTRKKIQNISIKINKKTKQPIFSAIYEDD